MKINFKPFLILLILIISILTLCGCNQKITDQEKLVNKIESIKFNGVLLEIGEDKSVDIIHNINIANDEELGVVKSSSAENKVAVAEDGTMSVNSLNVNKLVQTDGEELIINCGAAAR